MILWPASTRNTRSSTLPARRAVYAVLPLSFAFLVAYSYATQRFSRAKLFNIIISVFLVLFAAFAWFYPQHQVDSRLEPLWRDSSFSAGALVHTGVSPSASRGISASLDGAAAGGTSRAAYLPSSLPALVAASMPTRCIGAGAGLHAALIRGSVPVQIWTHPPAGRRSCTSTAWRRACRRGYPPGWRAASA